MKAGMSACMVAAAIVVTLNGCVMNKIDPAPETLTFRESVGGTPITVELTSGEEWSSRMQAGPFVFNVLPQFAVWAEDGDGTTIHTLYVTGADFNNVRHATKSKMEGEFFAQCLPVWASRARAAGSDLPSKQNPYPDSITSATPTSDVTIETKVPTSADTFTVFLEINKSGDTNSRFTEEKNDWAGQPSLIYAATVSKSTAGEELDMELIGHGGLITESPDVYTDLAGFDTALAQVDRITVRFH